MLLACGPPLRSLTGFYLHALDLQHYACSFVPHAVKSWDMLCTAPQLWHQRKPRAFPHLLLAALQMQVQNSHSFSRAAGLPGLLVLRLVGGTPPGVANGIGLGPEEWIQIYLPLPQKHRYSRRIRHLSSGMPRFRG